MDDFKVLLANANPPTNQPLIQKWFEFPLSNTQVTTSLNPNIPQETYLILDYQAPIKLPANDNIDHLNRLFEAYQSIQDPGIKSVAQTLVDQWFTDVIELAEQQSALTRYPNFKNVADVVFDWVDRGLIFSDIPKTFLRYVDIQGIGDFLEASGAYLVTIQGVIEYNAYL